MRLRDLARMNSLAHIYILSFAPVKFSFLFRINVFCNFVFLFHFRSSFLSYLKYRRLRGITDFHVDYPSSGYMHNSPYIHTTFPGYKKFRVTSVLPGCNIESERHCTERAQSRQFCQGAARAATRLSPVLDEQRHRGRLLCCGAE